MSSESPGASSARPAFSSLPVLTLPPPGCSREAEAAFAAELREGEVIRIPIKHGEGAYCADASTLDRLEREGQVLLRYCDAEGRVGAANPNGALRDIAGIRNAAGNVFGMMPHPEHAVEAMIGGTDGLAILGSLADAVGGGA